MNPCSLCDRVSPHGEFWYQYVNGYQPPFLVGCNLILVARSRWGRCVPALVLANWRSNGFRFARVAPKKTAKKTFLFSVLKSLLFTQRYFKGAIFFFVRGDARINKIKIKKSQFFSSFCIEDRGLIHCGSQRPFFPALPATSNNWAILCDSPRRIDLDLLFFAAIDHPFPSLSD